MMQLRMSTADANKPENSFLNRYRDVKPYDHTRVKLETHHDTDYINASLVRVSKYEVLNPLCSFLVRLSMI